MTSKICAALCVGATLVSLAFAATPAVAFTRTFLREIKETTPGSALNPGGIAVQERNALGEEVNDLWVTSSGESLAEFGPSLSGNTFLELLPKPPLKPPLPGLRGHEHLAVEDGSEDIYAVGSRGSYGSVVVYSHEGTVLREWGSFDEGTVTVDNAPQSLADPSGCAMGECTVYVTEENGESSGIEKFDSAGHPVPFTYDTECATEHCEYVSGNKITGIPGQPTSYEAFGVGLKEGLAVDAKGDIYAISTGPYAVYEYAPSGRFLRSFDLTSSEVPRVHEKLNSPTSVAVDPATGHLLVGVGVIFEGTQEIGAIDEFETEGAQAGKFVAQITEKSGGEGLGFVKALSVDSNGDVYGVEEQHDGHRDVVVYGPDVFPPVLTLAAATHRTGTGAQLNGTVNPNGFKLTQCEFQYVSGEAFNAVNLGTKAKEGFTKAKTVECEPRPGEVPVDTEAHEVKAQATGLTPGETYDYRLLAHNEEPRDGVAETGSLAFTAPAVPGIVAISAANISSTFADLRAQLAPHGAETSYRFEYLTAAAFAADGESFSGPDPAASTTIESIGLGGSTGGAVESVVQHIGTLAPASTYHYRVVAENAQGPASGGVCEGEAGLRPDCTFATPPATVPGLPDGRAYELVTPATKEGGSDMFGNIARFEERFLNEDDIATAESGEALLLETYSSFGPFPSAGHSVYVLHRVTNSRGELEWTYKSLASPELGVQTLNNTVFDRADLSRVGVNDVLGSPYTEEGAHEASLLGEPGGPYAKLRLGPVFHEITGQGSEPHEGGLIVGGSRDLSHVVLESKAPTGQTDKACPGAEGVKHGTALCEWAAGELKLVNVKSGSEAEPVSGCGAQLGAGARDGGTHQAVSADGSRIFFTAPDGTASNNGPGCWNTTTGGNAPQLYARIDATSTLELSEPEAGVMEAGSTEPDERPMLYPATFSGASEDGREVFFVTETWLTKNHPKGHDPELYECEIVEETVEEKMVPKCRLTRISIPSGAAGAVEPSEGGQVYGVQAVASEGTAVYFLAFGALAPGASKWEVQELERYSPVNLYRYQPETAAAPARMAYVATLSTYAGVCGDSPCSESEENWYTTPDGRYLLFYSELDLTADAHVGGECQKPAILNPGICGALYRYDAQAAEEHEQSLVCVSCDPNGSVPTGTAQFTRSANNDPSWGPVRAMSNNGEYVFFDTTTRLVPRATNGTLNVYEWHNGTISLLDSGTEPGPSYFLGYSPYVTPGGRVIEGGNVFIGTHDRLVAADTNSVGNIYDARVCLAESPCIQPPPGETAQCEGASCQTPPVPPAFTAPSTLTLASSGNITSEPQKTVTKRPTSRCRPGFVRKKIKKKAECVKTRTKRKTKKASRDRKAGR
jgi:hypothetical protein